MSSYIVRFFSSVPEQVRGTVRHVRTGEETVFSSPAELLRFFERVNATELNQPRTGRDPTATGYAGPDGHPQT